MVRDARFSGHAVVVTGGAGAIGSTIVRAFATEGATVFAWDCHAAKLDRVRDGLPPGVADAIHVVPVDLTDERSVMQAAAMTVGAAHPVHALVNAAGILRQGSIAVMSTADFDALFAVNVRGPFLAIKHLLPVMADGGAIVQLSSVAAYAGSDGSWAYGASKGAISSMTYNLAQEVAPRGIRVNAVCPGWVDGGFTDQARAVAADPDALDAAARSAHALGRMAYPGEVAEAVLFLADPRAASFITGSELYVDGGFMIRR